MANIYSFPVTLQNGLFTEKFVDLADFLATGNIQGHYKNGSNAQTVCHVLAARAHRS